MSGEQCCKTYKAFCDPSVIHQVSGQDKQRNGKHGYALDLGKGKLCNMGKRKMSILQKEHHSRCTDCKCNRHTYDQKDQKYDKDSNHNVFLLTSLI